MDSSAGRRAYHRLPMALANQAGWFMLNSHSFNVRWTGGEGLMSLGTLPPYGAQAVPCRQHFRERRNLPFMCRMCFERRPDATFSYVARQTVRRMAHLRWRAWSRPTGLVRPSP